MSLLVTSKARMKCDHGNGVVSLHHSQSFVTIEGTPILLRNDVVGRPVNGCSVPPQAVPCTVVLSQSGGWSRWITVNGIAVCLVETRGLTSGGAGTTNYTVRDPGQTLVEETKP